MKRLIQPTPLKVWLLAGLTLLGTSPRPAFAEGPIELNKNFVGMLDVDEEGPQPFFLAGKAPHLGKFTATGEVEFVPGQEPGSLVGEGVAVFTAADGDQLVGVVSWNIDPAAHDSAATSITFHWRDSVTFSDGNVVHSTGRFVDNKPPGLVVIAIIAVLIGLLLPAVQKVREA